MQFFSRAIQYYRYLRIWNKVRNRNKSGPDSRAEELRFYSQFLGKGDICFDIGANIGDKCDLFLELGAKVIAVEPQESCWRVLNRRFKNDNLCVEAVALADKEEVCTLFTDRSHTLATISKAWINSMKESGRFPSHKWSGKLSVRTKTLDTLIMKYGKPVFCKIDVEGFELDVLRGLSKPIRTISLEFVPERIENSLSCIDYLANLGEAEFNYCLNDSNSFALSTWVDCESIKKILNEMDKSIENYGDVYTCFKNI
jgi:FkbM family methyltransferase